MCFKLSRLFHASSFKFHQKIQCSYSKVPNKRPGWKIVENVISVLASGSNKRPGWEISVNSDRTLRLCNVSKNLQANEMYEISNID